MCGNSENDSERCCKRFVKSKKGMRGQAGKQRFGAFAAKDSICQEFRRRQSFKAEPGQQKWMAGKPYEGAQDLRSKPRPSIHKRTYHAPPRGSVAPKMAHCFFQVVLQHHRRAVIQGMGHRCGRVNPLESVLVQWERGKKWRSHAHRMNGGAKIMAKAGQSKCHGACSPAGKSFGLEHLRPQSSLSQNNCC